MRAESRPLWLELVSERGVLGEVKDLQPNQAGHGKLAEGMVWNADFGLCRD